MEFGFRFTHWQLGAQVVRLHLGDWDEYDFERVAVSEWLTDADVRGALACNRELRLQLLERFVAGGDIRRLVGLVEWSGYFSYGSPEALAALSRGFARDAVYPVAVEAMRHAAPHLRRAGCWVVGALREERAVRELAALLGDPCESVCCVAMDALASLGSAEAIGLIAGVARDARRDRSVRVDAIHRLAASRRVEALPLLARLVDSDDERVSEAARGRLQDLAPWLVEAVAPAPAVQVRARPIPYNRRWLQRGGL